ncbi:MAG: hypothetical protein KAQ83_04495, partial [Nanoarchaeota archaeon]|nr:hypothetical protein [Nanoarchaeota archaeon]
MNSTKLMAILIIELMLFFPLAAAFSLSEPMVQVNANSAAINWTTPVPADSEIQYGKTTGKDLRKNGAELILYHNLILENLEEFTKYYYKVVSKDENGTLASYPAVGSGQELSFITPDLTPPPKVQSLVLVNATAYTVEMEWGHVEVIDFDRYEIFRDGELVKDITSTSYIDTELLPGMPYEYKVRAVDDYENSGDFSDIIFINTIGEDKTPPVISNIRLSVLSETGATIAWDTDENSNSKIYYSPDETLGEEESKSDLVKEHGISINGLVDGWHYYYKVESCDARGNCMESSVDDFVAGSDYEPPFIEANVPEYYNEVGLDFDVETEAYADVKVYVNDLISRSSNAGENGEVHFDNIILKSILPVNLVKVEAVDAAGNSASQEFNVYLDFEAPELVIQTNVSEVIKQGSFSIQGYVTEQSTVSFYVEQEPFSFSSPGKVNGLFLEKVEDGFIEFSWNKSTANDLDEYLIYREDVGLIGIAGTELFIDTNVIAGETYTYWVSALDYDCLEGEYSSELIVKTLEEQGFPKEFEGIGNAPVEDLEQVVPECRQKIPILQIETSGSFNEQLSLREGNNKLIIVAEDIYGNSVNVSYDSLYDSQPPVFNSINLGAISPSYNQQVRVSGNLSEPCLLEVYV